MKPKRFVKDTVLVLLIFLNLFLVAQIWFNSNLLPANAINNRLQEYIITPVRNFLFKEDTTAFSQNVKYLTYPQKIVLNQANKRAALYSDNETYMVILEQTDKLLNDIFLGEIEIKSREMVSMDDYCAVLKRNSIYLDYENLYDFRLFSVSICGETKNKLSEDISIVRECILSLGDNVLNNVALYVKDYKSGNIMRYIVDTDKDMYTTELTRYFDAFQSENTLNYSFELNFHKQETGDGTLSKLVFEPMILFNLVASEGKPILTSRDSTLNWSNIDDSMSDGILESFRINPMTMRKYTDLSNARVFVENDATLTLYPNSILEYQTIEGGQGLLISDSNEKSLFDIYAAASAAVDFVYKVNNELFDDSIPSLRFSSDLTEGDSAGKYVITLDLYANGLPVFQLDPISGDKCHAVTIVIENGYLKYYRQIVRQYNINNSVEKITPVINAVDGLVDSMDSKNVNLNILNAGRCYVDEGNDIKLVPQWKIDVEGIENILTVK